MLKRIYAFFLLRLAQKYFLDEKMEKGISLLEKSILIKPDYSFAYFQLAKKFLELEEWEKAKENIKKAISFRANNAVYYTFLGIILYE